MAIIHQGKNENQEKMDRYLEKESRNVRKKLEERRGVIKKRRIMPIRLLLILASVGLILLFVLHPELIQKFVEETHRYCDKLGNGILKGLKHLPDAEVSENLILGLSKILLKFVLYLLSFIPIVLIWLIQISSKVAVPLLCFAILGLIAFSNVKKLAWKIGRKK